MFPFTSEIEISTHLKVNYSLILKHIGPLLTEARRARIDQVVKGRNFSSAVVLEGIYDRGNISAVMRSAEGLGFANCHIIETGERFKESARVTAGADKWVETTKWKRTSDCVQSLKAQGYKIIVTHLDERSKPLHEVDFSGKTALVLGNEKDGVSPEMVAAADVCAIVPMSGFVQSFNISVAGALSMYHIHQDRLLKLGRNGDLTEEQQEILKAIYYMRTQDSAADILENFFNQGSLA